MTLALRSVSATTFQAIISELTREGLAQRPVSAHIRFVILLHLEIFVPPETNQLSSTDFDSQRAEAYDAQFTRSAAIRENLHLLTRILLGRLPKEARLLCVGAGTGPEVIALGSAFPDWQFTVVDPSSAMLRVCKRKTDEAGLTGRCTFHEGYIDSLRYAPLHDAATSFLVAHFIPDAAQRHAYYSEIRSRLKPGGVLLDVSISAGPDSPRFEEEMEGWMSFYEFNGAPEESRKSFRDVFGKLIAAHGPGKVEALLESAGFSPPVPFFQSLLIRGWMARNPLIPRQDSVSGSSAG